MKELPIGIQDFKDLRNPKRNCLYIDKTQYIYKLTTTGKVYFLSRPRRFGKSLLVSTIKELFEGHKELFEGLYIYDKWDWSKKYPVIRLDFGQFDYEELTDLKKSLIEFVQKTAKQFGINLVSTGMAGSFSELIEEIYAKTGQQVVVLIDEYDKAMTDFLSEPAKSENNRTVLHNFYQVLKAVDGCIQFIFLTGISKFSGVSVFSALNNPDDITRSETFAAICGYTQIELETNFADFIDELSKKIDKPKTVILDEIKHWYNGYTWDGATSVYNPFSTLSLFRNNSFDNYWIKTGGSISTKLLLKDPNLIKDLFNPITVDGDFFNGYSLNNTNAKSYLFQAGYLTIKERRLIGVIPEFDLGIPNEEIHISLTKFMISAYSEIDSEDLNVLSKTMQKQIRDCDGEGLENSLRTLFAKISYKLHISQEKYYHSMLLLMGVLLGFDVNGEVGTNLGSIDAVCKQANQTTVIEIKYSKDKSLKSLIKEALKQIKEKKYYEAYMQNPVNLLAIAFAAGKKENRLTEIKCVFEEFKG
jgi:hypothetical protein